MSLQVVTEGVQVVRRYESLWSLVPGFRLPVTVGVLRPGSGSSIGLWEQFTKPFGVSSPLNLVPRPGPSSRLLGPGSGRGLKPHERDRGPVLSIHSYVLGPDLGPVGPESTLHVGVTGDTTR